jgi:hypothetical protein
MGGSNKQIEINNKKVNKIFLGRIEINLFKNFNSGFFSLLV